MTAEKKAYHKAGIDKTEGHMKKITGKGLIRGLKIPVFILVTGFLILYVFGKKSPGRPELNIIEKTNLTAGNINIPYKDFIKKNKRRQRTISEAKFLNQIRSAGRYLAVHPSGKFTEDLKEKIVQELGIGFLLEGINRRKLAVNTTATRKYGKYEERELIFTDPQVGSFSVLLLVPNKKKGPYPAIIGLHGHSGSGRGFRDYGFGKELASEGFVVIMPDFRAMCLDAVEEQISRELYLNGFTLMGLRTYETFLLIKYLKYKDLVNERGIGIMGHSGGSVVAYLASIISPDLRAVVYDMRPIFRTRGIHCQTIPGLVYYAPQMNGPAALKIPSRKFKYAYTGQDDEKDVIDFFKEKLMKE